MDVHVHWAITTGLRRLGVDVLTSQEDGGRRLVDAELLERAAKLGRVLFTQDRDFFKVTYELLAQGIECPGVIYASRKRQIGLCIEELHLISEAMDPAELANCCQRLPL